MMKVSFADWLFFYDGVIVYYIAHCLVDIIWYCYVAFIVFELLTDYFFSLSLIYKL